MTEELRAVTINIKTAGHEQLDGLIGGDDNGHYHLTEEEYRLMLEVLNECREEEESEVEYYKLNEEEYNKLTTILEMLCPDDDADAEAGLNALIDARINVGMSGSIIDCGEVTEQTAFWPAGSTIDCGEVTAPQTGV